MLLVALLNGTPVDMHLIEPPVAGYKLKARRRQEFGVGIRLLTGIRAREDHHVAVAVDQARRSRGVEDPPKMWISRLGKAGPSLCEDSTRESSQDGCGRLSGAGVESTRSQGTEGDGGLFRCLLANWGLKVCLAESTGQVWSLLVARSFRFGSKAADSGGGD
jgi:hypothetical protein